ncbi:MAG: glycosyltransferase family 4 protein, partial [Candidatus Asgardarchaeia archaeon]
GYPQPTKENMSDEFSHITKEHLERMRSFEKLIMIGNDSLEYIHDFDVVFLVYTEIDFLRDRAKTYSRSPFMENINKLKEVYTVVNNNPDDIISDKIKSLSGGEKREYIESLVKDNDLLHKFDIIDAGENDNRRKILFVAPHLSTGGMPEFLRKTIELMKDDFNIYVVEFTFYGPGFIVQRNAIIEMVGEDKFYTLGNLNEDKETHVRNRLKLIDIIEKINPDIVHIEEAPELFDFSGFPDELGRELYDEYREYSIYETSHNSTFNPDIHKRWIPDKFLFVSPWHLKKYKNFDVPMEVIEYPIELKERLSREDTLKKLGLNPSDLHVLHVGLFTPGKNQEEIFNIALLLKDKNIKFHFVGNQASNFAHYWSPLMKNKSSNCVIWGERNDVDNFYGSMDLFLFPSKVECNPVVIKEALGWKMPVLMRNLETYCGKYDEKENVDFLTGENEKDAERILSLLGIEK